MAKVVDMRHRSGIAGQKQIDARVAYDGGPDEWYTFVGSVYGEPGPVVMVVGTYETFVYEPSRFGEVFGSDWVLTFFEAE